MIDSQNMASTTDGAQAASLWRRKLESLVRAFLVRAVLWCVVFGAAHLLGFRAYTSVLSGASSYGVVQRLSGATYIVFYVGLVGLVPVLIIGAALLKGAALAIGYRNERNNTKGRSNQGVQPTP